MGGTNIQKQPGQERGIDTNRTNIIVNEFYIGAQKVEDKILNIMIKEIKETPRNGDMRIVSS